MNCSSINVIYLLKCAGCAKRYVGQTSIALRLRINLHKNQIQHDRYRILDVSKHIWQCSNRLDPKFYVMPLIKIKKDNPAIRNALEYIIIQRLKPELNCSINIVA